MSAGLYGPIRAELAAVPAGMTRSQLALKLGIEGQRIKRLASALSNMKARGELGSKASKSGKVYFAAEAKNGSLGGGRGTERSHSSTAPQVSPSAILPRARRGAAGVLLPDVPPTDQPRGSRGHVRGRPAGVHRAGHRRRGGVTR